MVCANCGTEVDLPVHMRGEDTALCLSCRRQLERDRRIDWIKDVNSDPRSAAHEQADNQLPS